MAKLDLNKIERIERERAQKQDRVEATYSIVFDEEKCVQLDTYGSSERKIAGKVSQSIRFDKESAKFMVALLKKEFDLTDDDCAEYCERLKNEEPHYPQVIRRVDIEFGDYDDFYEENLDAIDGLETDEMFIEDGNESLVINRYRVVIPKLHASFRTADWFVKDKKSGEWDARASVILQYAENEHNYEEYQYFSTMDLQEIVGYACDNSSRFIDPDELKCYIEFEQ